METIKVFLGMSFGRHDGYEYGTVLMTLANGNKVVGIDYSALRDEDDDTTWCQIITARPDNQFGWYAVDEINLDIEDDGSIYLQR